MASLLQSKVFTAFTHSQVYKPDLQPPLELLLKSVTYIDTKKPQTKEEFDHLQSRYNKIDPLVVFDHDDKKVRKTNEKDGIFYHLCHRPSVSNRTRNLDVFRPRTIRYSKKNKKLRNKEPIIKYY